MEFTIIQAVLPSFAVAALGYFYSVKGTPLDTRSIADLIYYIFSPCLVFSSLSKRSFHCKEFLLIGISVTILIMGMMIIVFLYMKLHRIEKKGFYLPIIFMNTGNIALPMALLLYGNEGLSKAIIFHLVNVMFLYSMGVFLVSKKINLKDLFKIPFLHAAIFGVLVSMFPVAVPEPLSKYLSLIAKGIDLLAKGAIPLLILSLGYSINRTRLPDLRHGLAGAWLRVFLGPAMAVGLILFFRHIGWTGPVHSYYNISQDVRTTEAVIILMASMPAPITSFLLNEKFDNCPEQAASMVLVGSLTGVFSIPFVLALSQKILFTH